MKPTNRQGGGARGCEEPIGHSGRQGKRRVPGSQPSDCQRVARRGNGGQKTGERGGSRARTASRRRKRLRDATHPGTEAGGAARRAGVDRLRGQATQGVKDQVRSHGRRGQPAANEERGERGTPEKAHRAAARQAQQRTSKHRRTGTAAHCRRVPDGVTAEKRNHLHWFQAHLARRNSQPRGTTARQQPTAHGQPDASRHSRRAARQQGGGHRAGRQKMGKREDGHEKRGEEGTVRRKAGKGQRS